MTEVPIQSLDVLGGVMFFVGLTVVTGMVTSAVVPRQRLGAGASLMVLGATAVTGPRVYQTTLGTTN